MGKYDPLRHHIEGVDKAGVYVWHATFSAIEEIVGFRLPSSARTYPAWWANEHGGAAQKAAWLEIGWESEELNIVGERVTFHKRRGAKLPSALVGGGYSAAGKPPAAKPVVTLLECSVEMKMALIGSVILSEGRLAFPKAPSSPAVYELRISEAGRSMAYIGETDNLSRRFGNYRNPGPSQQTSQRINTTLLAALTAGARVDVAAATGDCWIERGGVKRLADLSLKTVRCLFENMAILQHHGTEIESLNRASAAK